MPDRRTEVDECMSVLPAQSPLLFASWSVEIEVCKYMYVSLVLAICMCMPSFVHAAHILYMMMCMHAHES